MPQHEECNSYYEDFEGDSLFENCRACKILGGDNWNCIGASHKRKGTAQTGGGNQAQAFSLGDVDGIFAMALRKNYMPKCYNSLRGKTNSATSSMKNYVMSEYGNKCAVCQSQENVTVAHILKRKKDCSLLKVEWDASNFIALCGTEGEVGTCHSLFDNFQMSFVHGDNIGGWRVVGGKKEYHEKLVNLATNPPKRSLHSHFARCVLNESLSCDDDEDYDYDYDLDVSDNVEELGDIGEVSDDNSSDGGR